MPDGYNFEDKLIAMANCIAKFDLSNASYWEQEARKEFDRYVADMKRRGAEVATNE